MTEIEVSSQRDVDSQQQAWSLFEARLGAYLGAMRHVEDHLVLETPDAGEGGTAPYAQVDLIRPGVLRGELSGNAVLDEVHRLDKAGRKGVRRLGWEAPDPEQGFPNYRTEVDVDDAEVLAKMIAIALGEEFRIADPELLTYRAWGPAADEVAELGLAATDDVPTDRAGGSGKGWTSAAVPKDREHLITLVGEALADVVGDEVERDEDGDLVLDGGHRSYVRVRTDEPTIEVFTRLVHEVESRRRAAVEVSLLNRDLRWAKVSLADRSVYLTLTLPGSPFSPEHVRQHVPLFQQTVLDLRDDLALRTGGRVG